MQVSIYQRQEDLPLNNLQIEDLVKGVFSFLGILTDEIIFNFVSKNEISQIHEEFFNDPSPTDCITFPIDTEYTSDSYSVIGEAFICPAVGIEYAPNNPYEEVSLYIVHCILHLLGYEDIEEEDQCEMRKEEKRLLSYLSENRLILVNPSIDSKKV